MAMRRLCVLLWAVLLVLGGSSQQGWAFKTSMHVRTANVAMLDARDGAVCMPGLTQQFAAPGELPPQIPLASTPLQHFWHGFDAQGNERTEFRSWLIQYAPYVRAGAVGPDGYPDMLTGQLNIHPNTAVPYECTVSSATDCEGLHGVADELRMRQTLEIVLNSIPVLNSLLKYSKPEPAASPDQPTFGGLKETITGKPHWRSIDWAHEVLYRALHYREEYEERVRADATLSAAEKLRMVRLIQEQRRGAVAFALGFFIHMIGDGHIHSLINEIVAMPWSYFATRESSNAVYGFMSSFQEEFQHMAIERYLNDSYAPGAEDPAIISHVSGDACLPYVALDEVNPECVPEDEIVFPPLPCHVCNPLRSTDPTDVSSRCDHCFVDTCNPWRELCTVELPPGPICTKAETCDNHATKLAACAALPKKEDQVACRRAEERACSVAREQCACVRSVDVLVESGVMTKEQSMLFSCLNPQAPKLVEESDRFLGRLDQLEVARIDRAIPEEVKEELRLGGKRQDGSCDTRPLDLGFIRANIEEPLDPEIMVMVDGEVVAVPGEGLPQDLNNNGAPDLLNECVMLNCQMSPHLCPWEALDRDLDERAYADILPCYAPDEEAPVAIRWAKQHPHSCAEVEQGLDSIEVDPKEVMKARVGDDVARAFMQSTYTLAPKQFITDFFYMDRRYSELAAPPGQQGMAPRPHTAADFVQPNKVNSFGSFSLGGFPVNAVHAMIDLLRLIDFYVQAAVADPLGLARAIDPGGDLDTLLTSLTTLGDLGGSTLRSVADALANSPLLNYTIRIKIPFFDPIVIRIEIGRALARPLYILADKIEAVWAAMLSDIEDGAARLAVSIGEGVNHRIINMNQQLRREWVEVSTCMMEAVTSHQDIGYAVSRMSRFFRSTAQILILGGPACEKPKLVDTLRNAELSFEWTLELVRQIGTLQFWIMCEAERVLLQKFYRGVIEPAMEKISREVITFMVCDQYLNLREGDKFFKSPSEKAVAYESCAEMIEVMTRPLSYLRVVTEPLKQKLLNISIKLPRLKLIVEPVKVPLTDSSVPAVTGAQFELVTLLEFNLYEFLKSMRLILRGACWDGGNSELDVGARDQVRAAFGDFDLRGPDGKHKCATQPQPIQAIAQRAQTIYETDNQTPRNSQFAQPDPQLWIFPDAEFARRDGPPMIKALDRLMQIADPYAQFKHKRPQINFVTKALEEERMHAMNSVAFWPTYNTVQINKLVFMGPGSPTEAPCFFEELECQITRGQSCERALDNCRRPIHAAHKSSGMVGEGVHGLIFAANGFDPEFAGSGSRGWRASMDVYPDASLLSAGGASALSDFFQEQYISDHDEASSEPGARSCKDLLFNPLCNAVYDLDNPDDYCRNAHAWAYEMAEGIDHKSLLDAQVTWPLREFEVYDRLPKSRLNDDWIASSSWRIQDHDNCAWLTNSDDTALLDLTSSAYKQLGMGRAYKKYAPQSTRLDWEPILRGVSVDGSEIKEDLFISLDKNATSKWSDLEHARDYTPHQRGFLINATQNTLPARATGQLVDGSYVPPTPDVSYTPTRFSLANKDKHVVRLYAKMLAPFYCPLSGPDQADADCDGVPDLCDNCPRHYNPTQQRSTQRAGYTFAGDACLPDASGAVPAEELRCVAPAPLPPPDVAESAGCCGGGQCDTTMSGVGALWGVPWLLGLVGWRRRRRRG
jgi:hypothetical protein